MEHMHLVKMLWQYSSKDRHWKGCDNILRSSGHSSDVVMSYKHRRSFSKIFQIHLFPSLLYVQKTTTNSRLFSKTSDGANEKSNGKSHGSRHSRTL
ncbi:hypothetical protein TNCT_177481 [Trichonephila clavata]|uniref:Uncharacterized protein n=1 Tax=Trichonephila clavata TaxID=2740835 RepID=A0A8X6KYD0_TRICU|nr:hypothetical protein TNCT_177481 [Trichonephila clavata]